MKYTNYHIRFLSDLYTPLGLYIKLRDRFSKVLLLESSDYSSKEDSQSFLCFDSMSSFVLENGQLQIDGHESPYEDIVQELDRYQERFISDNALAEDGLFGFSTFDSIQYFDSIKNVEPIVNSDFPTIRYDFFRFTIKFDHFKDTLEIIEHCQTSPVLHLCQTSLKPSTTAKEEMYSKWCSPDNSNKSTKVMILMSIELCDL